MPARARKPGTMVKVALYLRDEVGEGGVFTSQDLRDHLPGVEQVTRRLRDLRPQGWVIDTYREDRSLQSDQFRLVAIGVPVWDPSVPRRRAGVSAVLRRQTFERDNHTCVLCGAIAGDPDGKGGTVRITVGHVQPQARGGLDTLSNTRTECATCNEAVRHLATSIPDIELLRARIRELSRPDKTQLRDLIRNGRSQTKPEAMYSEWRRLPEQVRAELSGYLDGLVDR